MLTTNCYLHLICIIFAFGKYNEFSSVFISSLDYARVDVCYCNQQTVSPAAHLVKIPEPHSLQFCNIPFRWFAKRSTLVCECCCSLYFASLRESTSIYKESRGFVCARTITMTISWVCNSRSVSGDL